MWSDIKNDVDDKYKIRYSGSGFDVVFSRSLNRLVDRRVIWKMRFSGNRRAGYWITPKGSVLANKLLYGLSVEDVFRDEVLAFGYVLQRLRDDAIISCKEENVVEYFKQFKQALLELDLETFIEEMQVYNMIIESDVDPLDFSLYDVD